MVNHDVTTHPARKIFLRSGFHTRQDVRAHRFTDMEVLAGYAQHGCLLEGHIKIEITYVSRCTGQAESYAGWLRSQLPSFITKMKASRTLLLHCEFFTTALDGRGDA